MKRLTVILGVFTLVLSLGVSAAPPGGGQGGGRGMNGAMPGQAGANHSLPTAPTSPQTRHEQPDTRSGGRSTSEILSNNTKLASQIHDLTDTDAQQACSGFKNLGDCVSAAHVSKNLGIGFDTLRTKVTGADAQSLGQAIQDLKPDADAKSEVSKARKQAKDDLK